jgi:hypothetical protein
MEFHYQSGDSAESPVFIKVTHYAFAMLFPPGTNDYDFSWNVHVLTLRHHSRALSNQIASA